MVKIIHHMKDGSVRDSIGGKIPNGEFYRVLRGILEKRRQTK